MESLELLGKIAGVAGIALGVFLLVFRDLIRKLILPRLGASQAYRVVRLAMVLTFLIAITGIAAWVVSQMLEKRPSAGELTAALNAPRAADLRRKEIQVPIDNLYASWERHDLDLYRRQWAKDAVQVSDKYRRTRDELLQKRARDFAKYKSVLLKERRIDIEDPMQDLVTAYVTYTMRFVPWEGVPFEDADVKERYKLRLDPAVGQWVIVENYTYLRGGWPVQARSGEIQKYAP
jgi:hypothetical protein